MKVILITGGSSGIGFDTAKTLPDRWWDAMMRLAGSMHLIH